MLAQRDDGRRVARRRTCRRGHGAEERAVAIPRAERFERRGRQCGAGAFESFEAGGQGGEAECQGLRGCEGFENTAGSLRNVVSLIPEQV
jgi:hypothetical protein